MRLRDQSQEPAQTKTVGPIGNRNLIACNEAKRGPSAVYRRPIRQIFAQIMSKFFLRSTTDRNYDMRWPALLYQSKKIAIFDFQSVLGRDITILDPDWRSFAVEIIEQFLSGPRSRQDPENACAPLTFQPCEKLLQIFQARNALNFFASQQSPREHHQRAVRDCEVG